MSIIPNSPSKGTKRSRDGKYLLNDNLSSSTATNVSSSSPSSSSLVTKFYLSFVNDAIEKKNQGIFEPYNELISQFTSTHFQNYDKIIPWLDTLSNFVSQLDKSHLSLIDAILSLSWTISSRPFVKSFSSFVAMLISAHPEYSKLLLVKLIKSLTHQSGSKALDNLKSDSNSENSENLNRRNVFDRIHTLLIRLINLVPTLPSILQPIIIRHFPHKRESKIQQMTYIKNLLTIINYCPSLGDEILGLIVDRTIQIDVEIQVELDDIDDEFEAEAEAIFDNEPDIFEREIDKVYSDEESDNEEESDEDNLSLISDLSSDDGLSDNDSPAQVSNIKELVNKLDGMLEILFSYLEKSKSDTHDVQFNQFSTLLSIFERTILPTFRSRYTQFILFKYSSFNPHFSDLFQGMLLSKAIFQNEEPSIIRIVAASYLASYVSRARFIDSISTKRVVGLMCDYISNELDNIPQPIVNFKLQSYNVWYSIVQAVFYIFCFRWRELILSSDEETVFDHAEALPVGAHTWIPGLDVLQRAILSPLNPLKICASNVVNQFAKVSQFAGFLYCHSIIESNKRSDMIPSNMTSLQTHANQSTNNKIETHSLKSLTMASNVQQVELDSFFPFDPYRLPHTQKYLKDIFRNWDEVAIGDEEDEESDEESETNPSQSLGKSLEAMSISPVRESKTRIELYS